MDPCQRPKLNVMLETGLEVQVAYNKFPDFFRMGI